MRPPTRDPKRRATRDAATTKAGASTSLVSNRATATHCEGLRGLLGRGRSSPRRAQAIGRLVDEPLMAQFPATAAVGPSGERAARRGPTRAATTAIFGGMGCMLLAYFVYLLVKPDGAHSDLIDGWAVCAFELTASVLCLSSGFRRGRV